MRTTTADAATRWTRAAIAIVVGVTVLRLAYQILLSPYELAGDEAQYWVWSRHLDWSYYSKGPGVAWTIAAATNTVGAPFGVSEWVVRLPAVLFGAIAMTLAALLAAADAPRRTLRRARLLALGAAAALVAPGLHGVAMLMTIDGPLVALWLAATLVGWRAVRALNRDASLARAAGWGAALGAILGIGALYKFTMLLWPLALPAWLLITPRNGLGRAHETIHAPASRWTLFIAVAALVTLATLAPVGVWNAQHDWVTVRHVLGQAGLPGGDLPDGSDASAWTPAWMLEYIGAQLLLAGPVLVLAVIATLRAHRHRRPLDLWLACAGWPILIVYLGVSLFTETQGNWAIAGFLPLAVLGARHAEKALRERAARLRAWRALPAPRPRLGIVGKRPETWGQILWHWSLGFGIVGAVLMLLAAPASRLPVVGPIVEPPVRKMTGARELAQRVASIADERGWTLGSHSTTNTVDAPHAPPALIAATRYQLASRLGFYLPGRPPVSSAAAYTGDRKSSHDFFDGVRLDDPALVGRPAILVGGTERKWRRSELRFAGLATVDAAAAGGDDDADDNARPTRNTPIVTARAYRGVRTEPGTRAADDHARPGDDEAGP